MSVVQPPSNCARCPRLVALRKRVKADYPQYHAAPVPVFGATPARLLVVGLAPGMHGANASGRPFSGDASGVLLYRTLHAHGFASTAQPSRAHELRDCRVSNAVKCLPPGNQPVAAEINRCNRFLASEIGAARVVVALGGVAHKAIVRALGLRQADCPFEHARRHVLGSDRILLDSYHCSRYNLNTRQLTPAMFDQVFALARRELA